ncbi:MAG: ABC transporter permease [Acidimicrobiales bacterium]|nr:ABC transporter permease [Acidimicrobiales bacterium]
MSDYLAFALLGLAGGAAVAMVALGVLVAYKGSGVINFAQGAMAMWATYVFSELRTKGAYPFPVPGLPDRYHVGTEVAFVPSLVLALATAALLGLAVHLLVFRPLRRAPVLAKVVASIGVMLVLQSLVLLRFDDANRRLAPILPNEVVELGSLKVPRDNLYLAALVVAVAVVLWLVYRFTRFGLATRAAAENEKGATLLGFSSDSLAGANWVLASVIGAIGGILAAPVTGLDPIIFTLLVVPALGACLLGQLRSFGITAAAGLGLGMIQSVLLKVQTDHPGFPRIGVREGIPFLVIVAAIYFLGKRLPARGTLSEGRLPFSPRPRPGLLTVGVPFVVVAALVVLTQGGWRLALVTSIVAATMCLSFVVLTGYVGQISLAQMALAGVAGFSLSRFADQWGVPFPLAPLMAASLATVFGLLVGLPALRVRGINLAIVTLAGGVAVQEFVFKNPDYTGASTGGAPVPNPTLFGIDLGFQRPGDLFRIEFGLFALVVLVLVGLAVANLRRAGTGRRMLAVRSNERAAAAAGIDVARTKLLAFGISSFVAGVAGCMIAYQQGAISDISYGVFASLTFLAFAYLGGISSVSGALIAGSLVAGGIVFKALEWVVSAWSDEGLGRYELLIGGLALIITAIVNPEGIAGAARHGFRRLGVMAKHPAVAPAERAGTAPPTREAAVDVAR